MVNLSDHLTIMLIVYVLHLFLINLEFFRMIQHDSMKVVFIYGECKLYKIYS